MQSRMNNILQLYNSGCVVAETSSKGSVNIDIKRFTVLLSGAFGGIEKIIEKRLSPEYRIGFGRNVEDKKLSAAEQILKITKTDLEEYGILPELLGRIGTILTIPPLTLEDYCQLLRGENGSVQCQYRNYLRGLCGVSCAFTDEAVETIAQICMNSGSGTRAVMPVINDLMRNALSVVERDERINAVIVETVEQELRVRYEYGERGYCYSDSNSSNLPMYRLKGKTCAVLTGKLCRYHRKAGGDPAVLPVLYAFLECSLEYLSVNAVDEEFCFASLEKLARTVQHSPKISKFELLMGDGNVKSFDRFSALYTTGTQRDLVIALQRIMDYLETYHGRVHIQFVLKKNN